MGINMLSEIIFISSILILFIGLFILLAMISNKLFTTIQNEVNDIAGKTDNHLIKPRKVSIITLFVKRTIDIVFSIVSLIPLSPLFLSISIAIKLTSEGPAIIKFHRRGMNGKLFYTYKFRTIDLIKDFSEKYYLASSKDPRITKIGMFLRKTALDELPNIINVLIGNMSIVGTTIAREFEYESIPSEYLEIIAKYKPGLTSLWVVSRDREMYSYDRRLLYDLYYINNFSIKLDLSIIYKTFILILGETASS
jgi:lipopolysaccharide/colanic/teichoic acid biosynthesis glycosyltransferase